MNSNKHRLIIILLMSFTWLGIMTYLSHQTGTETAQESYRLAKLVQVFFKNAEVDAINQQLRHMAHEILFMILTVLMCGAGSCLKALLKNKKIGYVFIAFPFFWSWFDEFTKPMIPGRHNDGADVLRNLLGCAIGLLFYILVYANSANQKPRIQKKYSK